MKKAFNIKQSCSHLRIPKSLTSQKNKSKLGISVFNAPSLAKAASKRNSNIAITYHQAPEFLKENSVQKIAGDQVITDKDDPIGIAEQEYVLNIPSFDMREAERNLQINRRVSVQMLKGIHSAKKVTALNHMSPY